MKEGLNFLTQVRMTGHTAQFAIDAPRVRNKRCPIWSRTRQTVVAGGAAATVAAGGGGGSRSAAKD